MKVFRLSKRKYSDSLSGKGAAKYGNRWNSKGVEIIYTSASRALAMAEVIVHLPLFLLPKDYVIMTIEIPDNLPISTIEPEDIPDIWNKYPNSKITQRIGDQFIQENKYPILRVPSAVVKGDFNYLFNPYHESFKKIKIKEVSEFRFDSRLFKS